jgi:outer membrane biogenesis lipoprotein LolB
VSLCRPGYYLKVSLLLLLLLLAACATVKKAPLTGIVPGREVETLQSAISISVKSGEHSTSGRGYLIFKAPDRFHMAVLSPFGLTVLELFLEKDRLTCLVPSRQTAYSGLMSELPENSGLQSMSMMKWVVAKPPASEVAGAKEFTAQDGDRFFFDEHGLVERKLSREGNQVQYQDYQNINGVAFPSSLLMENPYGARVKIIFDDPQINQPVEDAALAPNLEGYTVLPLAEFKGV